MNFKRLYYSTIGGIHKNIKLLHTIQGLSMLLMPKWWLKSRYKSIINSFETLPAEEKRYIQDRVDYYCHITKSTPLPADSRTLKEHTFFKKPRITPHSVYFFDTFRYTRYFSDDLKVSIHDGDVSWQMNVPTITKSRPVATTEDTNNVLLKLNRVRHFIFIHDPFSWEEKEGRVLFRGVIYTKENRKRFVEQYGDDLLCDLKDTDIKSTLPERWKTTKKMSIYDHLSYRYIMALEGNDVASNLKWVMSSNSIAVMPQPTCETWFMEGRLIPDYHYIEIASDFHDLIEKITYYEGHPEEAKAIISHANEWVSQFKDKHRERMIGVLTAKKYFEVTNLIKCKVLLT